ncbi:hypothetical protein CTI12_AA005160 [Artemisia annua]|uniref:Zinc finger, CCHC-type n=1 Tax=Artemisia annua TaxID=35608 RepID=A0A2U1QNN4_ARTAN|nr:hypothetical protein CTI12_AA005160 [Artemisia annua]
MEFLMLMEKKNSLRRRVVYLSDNQGLCNRVSRCHDQVTEKGLPKKATTPAVLAINAGRIQKHNQNKKPQAAAKGKNHGNGKARLAYVPLQFGAYDMLQERKTMFSQQAEQEFLETVKAFYACKQEEGQFVSSYVLNMKGYINNLECLGRPMSLQLSVNLILTTLSKEYEGFVQNYNMHSMGKTINEVHAMIKLHEKGLPKKATTPADLRSMQEGSRNITKTRNRKLLLRARIMVMAKLGSPMLQIQRFPLHQRRNTPLRTQPAIIVTRWVTGGGIVLPI